ncbi:hypothetical protein MAR_010827 [Mya arenaria]|uniref:Uncharacterized protein n=1 Tax=Mya arenaria TaxID=6604 RepID=A0ABY7FSD3_MYAAR|nr:hypothetical protein MAR_010827 [Mya arenaria]
MIQLETFCDDNKADFMTVHNYEAPSKHNHGNNPIIGLTDSQLTPTFKVVRASSRKKRTLVRFNPLLEESIPLGDDVNILTVEKHLIFAPGQGKPNGADVNKNDGVYSRYFKKFITGGVYHFTFKIKRYGANVYQREQTYNIDTFDASTYELFVGYDIDDVRQFLQFTNTGVYNGKGNVQRETLQTNSTCAAVKTVLIMPKRKSRTMAFSIKVVDDLGSNSLTSNVASALNPWR